MRGYISSMNYTRPCRPGEPVKLTDPRPDGERVFSAPSENAAKEGYTRISAADPDSGARNPVGGVPAPCFPGIYED